MWRRATTTTPTRSTPGKPRSQRPIAVSQRRSGGRERPPSTEDRGGHRVDAALAVLRSWAMLPAPFPALLRLLMEPLLVARAVVEVGPALLGGVRLFPELDR